MECCSLDADKNANVKFNCPECNNIGQKIQIITLENHVRDELKSKINSSLTYKFCLT